MTQFADYNRTIVGYHGTSRDRAERIVRTQSFVPSRNDTDWLGHGVYFWEYAPRQALRWAADRHGDQAAVVASMVRLGNCLDLLDPVNARELRRYHDDLERVFAAQGRAMPENRNAAKRRDCAVLEHYYGFADEPPRDPIESARGVYVPTTARDDPDRRGHRLWKRSWLTLDAHIQICVRPRAVRKCIIGTWPVDLATMSA